jgi:phosphotransferase system enzyme I (PtsI)
MRELIGISASPGIFMGIALLIQDDEDSAIPNRSIQAHEVEMEWKRFCAAQEAAERELTDLRDGARSEMGAEHAAIFDSHLLMLKDVDLLEQIEGRLKSSLKNIEWIVYQVEQSLIAQIAGSDSDYLAERAADIKDVSRRVLSHLLKHERRSLKKLPGRAVLVAKDLLPSEAMSMDRASVRAIALDAGGKTSHTAILARAFHIPAVLGLQDATRQIKDGDEIIVDGDSGRVIVCPDEATRERYEAFRKREEARRIELSSICPLPAVTLDGRKAALKANIEIPDEADDALLQGVDGIGLYRSEFLYLGGDAVPSEEFQYKAYARVLKAMGGLPVTIRTLDLGGDKMLTELEAEKEKNPLLGWRAIRFCLSRKDLFKTQLRALLRASNAGNLRVMFPMISGPEELDSAYAVLEETKADLRREGLPFREDIPVGIMIEVPSAAMITDILARKAAFFSIGTNDLIQYSIAVDRGNERAASLYQPFHPGVLRLIKLTIDNAHAAGIGVAMCGELAGDPIATLLLLGLGLDEFSMSPSSVPDVKRVIRSVTAAEAEDFARTAMAMGSGAEIEAWAKARMAERFGADGR